ncbi:MAG: S8 family serine peptidase [Planctomycetota bacterium]
MKRPATLFALAALLPTALLSAQSDKFLALDQDTPFEAPEVQLQGVGTEPVAGQIPGTFRYNVTFKTRSFDLNAFREATERRDVLAVDRIVRDLKDRAHQDYAAFKTAVEGLGGAVNIEFWLINACNIDLSKEQLAAVRALPNVLEVQPDLPTYPLIANAAPVIRVATDANHHNADAEQALGNKGTSVGVAIVDTSADSSLHGVNLPHMVYYRNADRNNHTGPGMDGSRLMGAFQMGSQPANNNHPHGTGVAGIAAGAGWNTVGADQGHSSDARVIVYSICNVAGSCSSSFAVEAAGWQQVAADAALYGTVTANMSYGSSPSPTDVSQQAIDACALNAGVLPVCAAGNSGPGNTSGSSSTANGLAVAAIDPTNKTVASFSSTGPLSGDTQRYYPDIAACGVNTVMPQWGNESVDWVASGTSMASPQVCGAAGLIKNARPSTNVRELKAILLNTTENISVQNPGKTRNDFGMGFLRDDIACSVARANQVLSSTINSTVTPNTHTMAVIQNQIYDVSLVWNRHNLASTAWSDLNLTIKNGATVIASSSTTRNLYEKVEFSAPITGNVTIEVRALSLEIANLPYSVAFNLSPANGLASVTLSGIGCVQSSPTFYEFFGPGTFDLSGTAIRMTPAGGGYLVHNIPAAYVTPTSGGLGLTDDSLSAAITLPFTLNFPGGSTNQIRVCSNGFIYLNGSGSSTSFVPTVADALTGGPRLFPGWTDLLPDGGANNNNVFYENDPANGRVLISWRNVPEYSAGPACTFQVVIWNSGDIDYVWQSYAVNSHNALVCFTPGNNGNDPGSRDLSTTLPFLTGPDSTPLGQNATRPLIGQNCTLQVQNIHSGSIAGVELLGIGAAGLDLTGIGAPSCFLYVNPVTFSIPFAAGGTSANVPLPIPNSTALLGVQVGVQAATVTPGLNTLGIATSNLCVLGVGQF